MSREEIYEEIEKERAYQDGQWGTDNDDNNTANDWVTFVAQYMTEGTRLAQARPVRSAFLKAASLLIAAIEAHDRNGDFPPRHYD